MWYQPVHQNTTDGMFSQNRKQICLGCASWRSSRCVRTYGTFIGYTAYSESWYLRGLGTSRINSYMAYIIRLLLTAPFLCLLIACEQSEPENVSFSRDIQPILARSCTPCHNPVRPQGNIDLSSYDALMKSRYYTHRDPIVLPGDSHDSRLYIVVSTRHERLRMPPPGSNFRSVSRRDVERIRVWIEEGANNN